MDSTIINITHEWNFGDTLFFMPINIVTLLLGFSLNGYLIFILLSPGLGKLDTTDVFTLNQAVSEILFEFTGPIQWLCNIYTDLCFLKPMGFIGGFCISAHPIFQTCVCLEHYLAVVHPVTFLRYKPLRYRVVHSLLAWACVLATGIVCTITYPDMPFGMFTALYMLGLSVDFFCCMSILKKLRHPGPGKMERGEREMNSFKKKAFQVVIMNLLICCIQILPNAITSGVQNRLQQSDFTRAMGINITINIITGFVQPIFVLRKAGKLSVCFPKNRKP